MAYNGSGTFVRLRNWVTDAAAGIKIRADYHDSEDDGFATGLSNVICKDGQSTITADIPFNTNKITGLKTATVRSDAANLGVIQDGAGLWGGTAGGTGDIITISLSPSLPAYAAGQEYSFISSAANTTNVTLNINSLGAKALTKNGSIALVANDIISGALIKVKYDGTRFQLVNVQPYAQGAAVASATTTVLNGTTGDYVHITGTTTITAITLAQGQQRTVVFDGILTLTNGASLINISGVDIATVAGDSAIFRGEASGVVRMIAYSRASGASLSNAALSIPNAGYVAGRYYFGAHNFPTTGFAMTANRLYFMPYIVGSNVTMTKIGINVTSGHASNARLGIYNMANGLPSTLVLDASTVSVSSTGEKEITITQALTPGIYALAAVFSGTPSITAQTCDNGFMGPFILGAASGTTYDLGGGYNSFSYAALPTSFGGSITYLATANGPLIWMRP